MKEIYYSLVLLAGALTGSQSVMAAPAATVEGIPEGETRYYAKECTSVIPDPTSTRVVWPKKQACEGAYAEWIFGADGETVYMRDPVAFNHSESYIRGSINGSTIIFEFPQTIVTADGELTVQRLLNAEGDNMAYYEVDPNSQSVEFNLLTNGTIKMKDYGTDAAFPVVLIGTCKNGTFTVHGDAVSVYTPLMAPATLPEGLEEEVWALTGTDAEPRMVKIARDGDDAYLCGLSKLLPDAWVKGSITATGLSLPSKSLLGAVAATADTPALAALVNGATLAGGKYVVEETLDFTLSSDGKQYTSGQSYMLGRGLSATALEAVESPVLTKQGAATEASAPTAPSILAAAQQGGQMVLKFSLSPYDVEGNIFDTANAYYNVYIDGEKHVFTLAECPGLGAATADIPYEYSDGATIQADGMQRTLRLKLSGAPVVALTLSLKEGSSVLTSEKSEIDLSEQQPSGIDFTYATQDTSFWGTGKKEVYDLCINMSGPAMKGKRVTGVKVPVADTAGLTYSAWVTDELDLDSKSFTPKVSKSGVPVEGWLTVKFDEPYEIGDDGVYVGYTITVDKLDATTKVPVATTADVNAGAFWVHTNRTYLRWNDQTRALEKNLAIVAVLDGEFPETAAAISSISDVDIKVNKKGDAVVEVTNLGLSAITGIDYTYSIYGETYTASKSFYEPIPARFNAKETFHFEVPSSLEGGVYELTMHVDKVNGVENPSKDITATAYVNVIEEIPVHRAVMEEFTGTWCGWCPRGMVGMELMRARYPETFIGIAYHYSDPMEMQNGYLGLSSDFPTATLDRMYLTDPYKGDGAGYAFGIHEFWQERQQVVAPCDVEVSAELTGNGKIAVTSNTRFVKAVRDEYRLAYVLCHDEMVKYNAEWAQSNYYAGKTEWINSEGMADFVNGDATIIGQEYNDVAIYSSGHYGIEGSLADIQPFVPIEHHYTFDLSKALNYKGESLVQDETKLWVAVLVLKPSANTDGADKGYGEVVNAARCDVASAAGLTGTAAQEVADVRLYSLDGLEVAGEPAPGVYMEKTTYANGQSVTRKVRR